MIAWTASKRSRMRQQHLVEPARLVGLGRGHELVVEAEAVEEGAQAGVVVGAEALVLAERVAHRRSPACRGPPPASRGWARCRGSSAGRPCRRRRRSAGCGIASSVRARKALRTMVGRATSPKVPMCGRPDGAVAALEDHRLAPAPARVGHGLVGLALARSGSRPDRARRPTGAGAGCGPAAGGPARTASSWRRAPGGKVRGGSGLATCRAA